MSTFDFDRFKDNKNTYLCKDTQGRQDLETAKAETDTKFNNFKKEVDKKFENLKNRYVLIGDSYLDGYTPDGNIENFGVKLKRLLKASDEDFVIVSHGGTGFKNVDASGKTFITMIDDAYNITQHPETITHFMFAGGFNDQTYKASDIQAKIVEAYEKMIKKFPNATMYIANVASIFNSNQADVLYNLQDHVQLAYTRSALQGHRIVDMGNIGRYLHERSMLSAKDGIHPVDYGQGVIATAMYYKLMGGDYFPVGPSKEYVCAYSDQYGNNSNVTMIENISGDTLTVSIRNVYFFKHANIGHESPYFIGTVDSSTYIRGGYDTVFAVEATGIVNYSGKTKNVPFTIGLGNNGKFFIINHLVNEAGTGYEDLNDTESIVFNRCFIRVPLGYS